MLAGGRRTLWCQTLDDVNWVGRLGYARMPVPLIEGILRRRRGRRAQTPRGRLQACREISEPAVGVPASVRFHTAYVWRRCWGAKSSDARLKVHTNQHRWSDRWGRFCRVPTTAPKPRTACRPGARFAP
eukprot:364429-Chlamydomonas_euryale.AAC.14